LRIALGSPPELGYGFTWRFSTAMLVGYLLATVPQVILDPRFQSHAVHPHRWYPFAYMITPIAIFVFAATVVVALRIRTRHRLAALVPFIAGCTLSAPIFKPEVPHGNLLFAGVVWMLMGMLTLWAHGVRITNPLQDGREVAAQACIEFIKEQTAFWKGIGFALLAAFVGVLVTLVQSLHATNAEFLSSRADLLLMARYINQEVALMSLFMLVGPLYEIALKILATMHLLLEIHGHGS
jgi:hypothetical protein